MGGWVGEVGLTGKGAEVQQAGAWVARTLQLIVWRGARTFNSYLAWQLKT